MLDLSDMNEAQRKAVTHGEGPLLLLAGPGSGKTFTITRRILYLLEQGVPPEQVLVITFTREAAESMQRRFQKISTLSRPVNFGTFHSIFYHMLQKSNTLRSTELLTNSEKKNLILPILKKYREKAGGELSGDSLREDAVTILAAVSYYKNTLRLEEAAGKVPGEWRQGFPLIQEEYERAVMVRGRLDFDDMLCRCRQMLLEDASFRRAWQGRFSHILIDEFQDTNPVQYEVVKLLAGENCNIFAVGDDDQSIYGFRGSEPECLKRFQREYGAKQMLLDVNYRSHPEIVYASLAVIGENQDRFEKQLRPDPGRKEIKGQEKAEGRKKHEERKEIENWKESEEFKEAEEWKEGEERKESEERKETEERKDITKWKGINEQREAGERKVPEDRKENEDGRRVHLLSFEGKEEQYAYLVKRLENFTRQAGDEAQAECAVLFRTNSQMQGLAVRLRAAGIPYVMGERMQSIYEHFIARDVTAYLRLASGEWDRELLLRVVNRPSRYVSREAVGDSARTMGELRAYYGKAELSERRRREILKSLESFERQLKALGRFSPGLGVAYVQKAVGYEGYLRQMAGGNQRRLAEWLELLEWLKADAGRFASVKEWRDAQEAHTKSLEQQGKRRKEAETGGKKKAAVRLMTVHGAKGLEFDTVILPDCNEGIFPHGRLQGEAEVEEERRVFYVAMTRAKENLELLFLTGEGARSRPPSRFLNPLLQDHSSTSSTNSSNSQLSRYSSKASATFSYSSLSSI